MKNIFFPVCLVFLAMLLNCSGKVDTTRDFAMVLNGREYKVALGPPVGRIQENEAGYSYSNSFTVVDWIRRLNG